MVKEEPVGTTGSVAAAAVAAMETHIAMRNFYSLPSNTANMPQSPQQQRQLKKEEQQEEQDFFNSQHCKLFTLNSFVTIFILNVGNMTGSE